MEIFLRRLGRKPLGQVACAFEIDGAVFLHAAFAGGNGVENPVERAGNFFQILPARDIRRHRLDAGFVSFLQFARAGQGLGFGTGCPLFIRRETLLERRRRTPHPENLMPLPRQCLREGQSHVATAHH